MKKNLFVIFSILFSVFSALFPFTLRAQSVDCNDSSKFKDYNPSALESCIIEKRKALDLLTKALRPNEDQLSALRKQIEGIKARVAVIQSDLLIKEKNINAGYKNLAKQQEILNLTIRDYYIKSYYNSPLALFLSSSSASEFTKLLGYQRANADKDKAIIVNIAATINDLETKKENLENEKQRLNTIKTDLDEEGVKLDKLVSGAKAYQAVLSGQIAQLTARQQEILSAKAGTFTTSVGDVPLADDSNASPNFNPGFSPAFAAFSFGAPHFKGMSQYGAFGRAKSGQSYETILRTYYGSGVEIRDHDQNAQITVDGYGTYSLEEYAKRIYEMPGSWGDEGGMEALKAQAIAARSYALARGGSICATESCQVFKPEPKGGNWERAVNDTAGKVIYANGSPFSAWYASTSGGYQESYSNNGYSTPGFWDTPTGRGGWTSQAYEKTAGSPWFYKGWYKTRSGDSCGRSHPWLTNLEMSDILNAWVVLVKHGQNDDRITPLGGCWGGNPYSLDELRNKASSLSIGYSSINSASVTYSDAGYTSEVTLQTDQGQVAINGKDFYKIFNLRAPASISLKSTLFNIEKK